MCLAFDLTRNTFYWRDNRATDGGKWKVNHCAIKPRANVNLRTRKCLFGNNLQFYVRILALSI